MRYAIYGMSGIVQVLLVIMLWKQVIHVKQVIQVKNSRGLSPHVHVRTWIICAWFEYVEVVYIPVCTVAMATHQYLTAIRGPIWCLWDFHCNLQALIYLHGHFLRSISSSFSDISSCKHITIARYTGIWNENTIHIRGCHSHVPKSLASNIQFSFPIFITSQFNQSISSMSVQSPMWEVARVTNYQQNYSY